MIWYDIASWSHMVWSDTIENSRILYNMIIWHDTVWCDIIWHDTVWCDIIWYNTVWCDIIWYNTVLDDLMHLATYVWEMEFVFVKKKDEVEEKNNNIKNGNKNQKIKED